MVKIISHLGLIDKSYETMIEGGGCFYVHLEATYDWEQRIQYENSDNCITVI